jgi:hypothetical protein
MRFGIDTPTERKLAVRKVLMAVLTGILGCVASGVAVCVDVGDSTAGASVYANKAAFCTANIALDRESANADSVSAFMSLLKAHPKQWNAMKKNVPPGPLGADVRKLINAVDTVETTGNSGAFIAAVTSGGGDVDTYCGVDGVGRPLPAYFNKGTKTSFCKAFLPVYEAVGYESSDAAALAALNAHKTQISQLASELSTLPKSVRSKATSLVDEAQTALSTNTAEPVTSDHGPNGPDIGLYCGQNQ